MVDDLGYADLGSYGQKVIKTPYLDKLANEGIRFTDCYAGSAVCAPSRSVLMTGKHAGHTTVRGNIGIGGVVGLGGAKGRISIRDEDITIAEVLKTVGYTTGMTGKWGIGEPNTTGLPNDQGFDEWFGFFNQRRAHHHYTDFMWLNRDKYLISEEVKFKAENYTHTLFTDYSVDFINRHATEEKPFFLYVPYLLPHTVFEIPEINEDYKTEDWTEDEKFFASMVSLIDSDVGRIMASLEEMGIRENTLVFFTSDNGSDRRWDGRFNSSGELKGAKRDVYEGGLRVPMIVSMPGTLKEGKVNSTPWYFPDVLPTLAEFAGADLPADIDGISRAQIIKKNIDDNQDRILYWEFYEESGKQAVRNGKWKAVRLDIHAKGFHKDIELYDLSNDIGETQNIAKQHPEIVAEMILIMEKEHTYSNEFHFDSEKQSMGEEIKQF